MTRNRSYTPPDSIAVIGIGGRFPGARNIEQLWQNLKDGVESISVFTEKEMLASGVDPTWMKIPGYVNAGCVLDDIDLFDAVFFGFSARDAEIMDPQQRLFLECAWESLEVAGYDPSTYPGMIAIFGGSEQSTYLHQLYAYPDRLAYADSTVLLMGNDKDYLATQVSYKLNLTGPSITVQTACSTSLVAVCLACQSLWSYQSDMALAGGVCVSVPQKTGYWYQPGGILSPDGHCRTFDAQGQGTVVGNGVSMVVLKRLADALEDGDHIYAVIKGAALNNDGSLKVGFSAPSMEGQAQAIAMAQAMAGVNPETIGYVEAHGTATLLGDPIEFAALNYVFRNRTSKKGFCALGSLKSNVGHLASAAGAAGLIKTVLMLENKMLVPSLNFKQPNPQIDFANSPFYVNTTLKEWNDSGGPRRAAVSSFGVGGTNAHVVLEEAPEVEASVSHRSGHLLVLSAKTSASLERATDRLAAHLKEHPELNLADVAYTMQVGRQAFKHRRMLVLDKAGDDPVRALEVRDPQRVLTAAIESQDRPLVFMFSGQGTQYVNMGLQLYKDEPEFRKQVDVCCEGLRPHLGLDLREVLYPQGIAIEEMTRKLTRTTFAQPALFTIEYALAKLWMSWGVWPVAMIGHSIGEYVAACLAEVVSLEDALRLIALRGQLMDGMPTGAMLAIPLSEEEAAPLLNGDLSLAAVNSPSLCVISGTTEAVDRVTAQLAGRGLQCRRLHTSHAFHSYLMEPVIEPFTEQVKTITLNPPKIPYVSNLTGTWVTPEVATDPNYWGRHLRQAVRFADGMREMLTAPEAIYLEVGPGQVLSTLVRQQPDKLPSHVVLSSMATAQEAQSDVSILLNTLGRLWLHGTRIYWPGFSAHEKLKRVPLPTYPFDRQCYWIGPSERPDAAEQTGAMPDVTIDRDISKWFYSPSWRPAISSSTARDSDRSAKAARWLIFSDTCGVGAQMARRLGERGQEVVLVTTGQQFARIDDQTYSIRPDDYSDYDSLLKLLRAEDKLPQMIAHLWSVTREESSSGGVEAFERYQPLGFYSLIFLAQALEKHVGAARVDIGFITNQVQAVIGDENMCPAKATGLGCCKVIPQEFPNITCRNIDLTIEDIDKESNKKLIDLLITELTDEPFEAVIAYRKGRRWVQTFERVELPAPVEESTRIRPGGVYVITGGLGNIGLLLAESMAEVAPVKLILTGRSAFPDRPHWEHWVEEQGKDDPLTGKILRLLKLEELGSEVAVFSADAGDLEQMREVIAQACERFGPINGVIHGAGNTSEDGFLPVSKVDFDAGDGQFRPKAHGAIILQELFEGQPLDFFYLLSSLSGVLGGLGLLAYASANIFLDALATERNQTESVPWISVNWDAWQFVADEELYRRTAANWVDFILPSDGKEAFRRTLDGAQRQVIVSTSDLQARVEQWINLRSLRESQSAQAQPTAAHTRPNLSTEYVAPGTAVQQTVATIWEQLLGVNPIGIYDKFFELGGHSLLAIQLISRVREAFGVELPPQRIFETPTIAQLSESIERDIEQASVDQEQQEQERMEELLRMVEGLSESEVADLLASSGELEQGRTTNG